MCACLPLLENRQRVLTDAIHERLSQQYRSFCIFAETVFGLAEKSAHEGRVSGIFAITA